MAAFLSQLITRIDAEVIQDPNLVDPPSGIAAAIANVTAAIMNFTGDPSSERGPSFHKSVPELWDKYYNDWVELLKTFADQDAMAWSKCVALTSALVFAYLICRRLLCRDSSQSFGWTMLTFVVALAIVYFEGESKLSSPMKFIVWLFSISLSLTYIRPNVALRKLNGIHTLLIVFVGFLLAGSVSWIAQTISSGGSVSFGAAFALAFPTASFIWRAVVHQMAWGERIDTLILELDVMDVLAYAGSHVPGWLTWIAQQIPALGSQPAEPVPLESVAVDGANNDTPLAGN